VLPDAWPPSKAVREVPIVARLREAWNKPTVVVKVKPREAMPVEAEVGWRSTMVVFSDEMEDSHGKSFESSACHFSLGRGRAMRRDIELFFRSQSECTVVRVNSVSTRARNPRGHKQRADDRVECARGRARARIRTDGKAPTYAEMISSTSGSPLLRAQRSTLSVLAQLLGSIVKMSLSYSCVVLPVCTFQSSTVIFHTVSGVRVQGPRNVGAVERML
jgi:hypothetical protein